ncbi:MAG: hypothetical protein KKE69_02150 [Alphaproteobacteria bacterium]|jgi:hypothetical protein|nr:hypothetical protein [Alphaproteobacteria bacterium]MBU1605422.1 hypothetical protein [Alphaproteobacteria bacterium]
MKTRFALVGAATLATLTLAACGDTEDASMESQADTVEIPANEALEGVYDEPVMDPQADYVESEQVTTTAPAVAAEEQEIEEASENAAANAAAAADAMIEE